MENLMGMKELYDVTLKASYPIKIGQRTLEPGEIIARFDKIMLANFQEVKKVAKAHGGYNDITYITWDTTKEVDLVFTQGIFSKSHLALLSNAQLIELTSTEDTFITQTDKIGVEEFENNQFKIRHPYVDKLFIYNESTGERITDYLEIDKQTFQLNRPIDVIVTYEFKYKNNIQMVKVGQRLIQGFLQLEGRVRTKDDITGKTKTGIIKIPKLKMMSDLSMRLGENASPMVATFKAIGYPVGVKGEGNVMDIYFLEDDIDAYRND